MCTGREREFEELAGNGVYEGVFSRLRFSK